MKPFRIVHTKETNHYEIREIVYDTNKNIVNSFPTILVEATQEELLQKVKDIMEAFSSPVLHSSPLHRRSRLKEH